MFLLGVILIGLLQVEGSRRGTNNNNQAHEVQMLMSSSGKPSYQMKLKSEDDDASEDEDESDEQVTGAGSVLAVHDLQNEIKSLRLENQELRNRLEASNSSMIQTASGSDSEEDEDPFAPVVAMGARCANGQGDAAAANLPAQLPQVMHSAGSRRAAAMITALWRCDPFAGVTYLPIRGGGTPVPDELKQAFACPGRMCQLTMLSLLTNNLNTDDLPALHDDTKNHGSGGPEFYKPSDEVTAYLTSLFTQLVVHSNHVLGNYDLFHGHTFAISRTATGPGEFGVLFHAKEYPSRMDCRSNFDVNHPDYNTRNILYLASTDRYYVINAALAANNQMLMNWLNRPYIAFSQRPELMHTVDEDVFYQWNGRPWLPHINYLPININQAVAGGNPMTLFTKAFSFADFEE